MPPGAQTACAVSSPRALRLPQRLPRASPRASPRDDMARMPTRAPFGPAAPGGTLGRMSHVLPPAAERRFEDYPVGAVIDIGSFTLSEQEILDFARRYDPQAMHTDPNWAEHGPFGGLIASGWHTISALMALVVRNYLPEGGLVSPGIDEVRWLLPVRPAETLRARGTITAARRSRSRPDRGLVHSFVEVLNEAGEPVLTMRPMNFIRCRAESLAPGE